jgi:hypothetical protein
MSVAFVLKKSADDQFFFILRADNNETVLISEQYTRKDAARDGIESVRKSASDDSRYVRKVSSRNQPYFVLTAANGEPLGHSEEYSSAAAMENGIVAVKRVASTAGIVDQT